MNNMQLHKKLEELKRVAGPIAGEEYQLVLTNIILEAFEHQNNISQDEMIQIVQEHIDLALQSKDVA